MKNNEITLNMRFAGIKVSKYSQYDLEQDFVKEHTPLVEFQTNIAFNVFEKEEKLGCLVTVKIIIIETKEIFAELKVENIFELKPFENIINSKTEGKYKIPDTILQSIASLSISTVRGILSEKLKGTIVQNEVYPLIDPSLFFKKKD